MKNLVMLWTGNFKDIDEGSESCQLASAIWQGVGADTSAAGSTIPSAYGVQVPNIAQTSNMSA